MASTLSQFETLFRQFHGPLVRFALKWVREPETAEELVLDVFTRIWKKRDSLQFDASLKSYLYTAVRNRAFNHLRDEARKAPTETLDEKVDLAAPTGNPVELADLKALIQQAIGQLPPRCRAIFLMSRESDMTYREIAAELDISPKTVEVQMGIALKKLRQFLEARGVQWLLPWLIGSQIFTWL